MCPHSIASDSTQHPPTPIAPDPPATCNTRAENSQGIDYVSLTHRHDRSGRIFGHLLGIPDDEWEELSHGGYRFRHCRQWNGVRVYYEGREDVGSYCQIPGDACRRLEATGKIRDWQEFAIHCLELYHVKCVRVDLYKDDRHGLLDIDELQRRFEAGHCTTHAQECGRVSKQAKGLNGKRLSDTLYIGSRKSDTLMRIYDKALESRPTGRKLDEWLAEHGHHVRVEVELKRKRAQAAMLRLSQVGFGEGLIPGLMRGFIDFKDGDATTHNGRRLPTYEPWREFLGDEAKVVLGVSYERPSLAKSVYYLRKQYAPTIAAEAMRLGGDKEELMKGFMDLVVEGKARMGRKHYRLLREAERGVIAA